MMILYLMAILQESLSLWHLIVNFGICKTLHPFKVCIVCWILLILGLPLICLVAVPVSLNALRNFLQSLHTQRFCGLQIRKLLSLLLSRPSSVLVEEARHPIRHLIVLVCGVEFQNTVALLGSISFLSL